MKERLDRLLAEQLGSRTRAADAIAEGRVQVNGKTVTKAGFKASEDDDIQVSEKEHDYVSRAGGKLLAALEKWHLDLENKVVLDIGASTGGFTQCALEHGASRVYALDVGHLQLSEALKNDPKVVEMEGINARDLQSDWFDPRPDFLCMDVSFISCLSLLEPVLQQLPVPSLVVLVKPQFECGPSALNRRGVVKSEKLALQAVEKVTGFLQKQYYFVRFMPSPVIGRSGNQEYLVVAERRMADD